MNKKAKLFLPFVVNKDDYYFYTRRLQRRDKATKNWLIIIYSIPMKIVLKEQIFINIVINTNNSTVNENKKLQK